MRSIPFVKDIEIPILGINTGRLGFLTSLQKESLNEALDKFFDEKFKLIKRALLAVELSTPSAEIDQFGYALNEISINRKNTTAMLSIATRIDKEVFDHLLGRWTDHCHSYRIHRLFFEQWRTHFDARNRRHCSQSNSSAQFGI